MMDNRDLWFDEVEVVSHIHSPVLVDSEDPLFWARSRLGLSRVKQEFY